MSCKSVINCKLEARREGEIKTDVLIAGGGLGGLAAALELRKYGYNVLVTHTGRLGGHHVLGDAPLYSEDVNVADIVGKAGGLELIDGFFDGFYIYRGDEKLRVEYKHLILATGGVDVPVAFPGGHRAPQRTAEEALQEPPSGLNIVVWGTTEWGLRTAITLRRRGNNVVVLDNSAYLRDVKYFEKVRSAIDFPVVTSALLRDYKNGELIYDVIQVKKTERVSAKADLIISAVRMVNPYVPMKLGFKVFYSFELNSLIPRRNNYGEFLILDETGRAVGGSNVYATGHLYGALRESHVVKQGKLLAMYIASKDGHEDKEKAKDALDRFLVDLTIEANWLYNLGNRLEKGTDGTNRYVEPNVIDVPHWASYWPQTEEIEDIVICPCNNMIINEILNKIKKINNMKNLKVKITHEETDLLRQLKVPQLEFKGLCEETICIPYAAIILGAALAQRPSYFLYGKPEMLYG